MDKSAVILLMRRNKWMIFKGNSEATPEKAAYIGAFMKNIESLGYTLSRDVINVLFTKTSEEIISEYQDLVLELKILVGADKEYRPMYPNFPKQVLDANDMELFVNAIFHYLSDGHIMPAYEEDPRFPLIGDYPLTEIGLGTEDDLMKIFTNLLASKTSLSSQDKYDLDYFIQCTGYKHYMPKEIPLKENCALFGKAVLALDKKPDATYLRPYFSTATDVLRLIAAISDEDISLSPQRMIRVKKMKRKERRFIMDLLAGCNNLKEDMFRYRGMWITVGEIMHPGEFKENPRYKKVVAAFQALRDNSKPETWGGKLEKALLDKDVDTAVRLLSMRPGEFARRLNKVLSIDDSEAVVRAFGEVAEQVASPVLWQVREHFIEARDNTRSMRVFFPKGNTAKLYATPMNECVISKETCAEIVAICDQALRAQYAAKPAMGKVYLDQEMFQYAIPFSQRSANSAGKILTRGSHFPIPEDKDVLRSYIWWTNPENGDRTDIDLSATIYNENWKEIDHISYTNLRAKDACGVHSGDIVNGGPYNGKGVAEFVDLYLSKVVACGGRYVLMQVFCFTLRPFNETPCSFGWMERNNSKTGKVFDPKTVKHNMAITAAAKCVMPMLVDCKERKVVWMDMAASERYHYFGNNLESNRAATTIAAQAFLEMRKPSLGDLIASNAAARGTIVDRREDADIIFSNDTTKPVFTEIVTDEKTGEVKAVTSEKDVEIITAYDLDYYMGELL